MFTYLFGNSFDFNNDGKMDNFEKRAEYMAFLNEVRINEGIDKELYNMNLEQITALVSKSGIDPSSFGF